jgi:hypothetical protein
MRAVAVVYEYPKLAPLPKKGEMLALADSNGGVVGGSQTGVVDNESHEHFYSASALPA